MKAFEGFDEKGFRFLTELKTNNERAWFDENKERYQEFVVEPSKHFLKSMTKALRARHEDTAMIGGKTLRIYRDVRFSKDKTPYKPRMAFRFGEDLSSGMKGAVPIFYIHLEEGMLGFYTGIYQFNSEAMGYYRVAVDDQRRGENLQGVVKKLTARGMDMIGEHYVRMPRGYEAGHPREMELRRKGIMSKEVMEMPDAAFGEEFVEFCLAGFDRHKLLYDWLLKL